MISVAVLVRKLVVFSSLPFYFPWEFGGRDLECLTASIYHILKFCHLTCVTRDWNSSNRTRLRAISFLDVWIQSFVVLTSNSLRDMLIGQISVGWITFTVTCSNCAILIMLKFAGVCIFGSWVWNSKERSKSGLSSIGWELHIINIFLVLHLLVRSYLRLVSLSDKCIATESKA